MPKPTGYSCSCGRKFVTAEEFCAHLKRDGAQVKSCK